MRKVHFEYFENTEKKKNEAMTMLLKSNGKEKGSEKNNVQGRSSVLPLIFASQHHQNNAHHQNNNDNILSENAKKTRDAKMEYFLGPNLKNGTIGQSLKSLTANLKGKDFLVMNQQHHTRTTRSLSPIKKLPPFPKTNLELSRWLLFKKEPNPERKSLNDSIYSNAAAADSSKEEWRGHRCHEAADGKKAFASIKNRSPIASYPISDIERHEKDKNKNNKLAAETAAANTPGYRIIRGSKITKFEKKTITTINTQNHHSYPHHQQEDVHEIAIDGILWSHKVQKI